MPPSQELLDLQQLLRLARGAYTVDLHPHRRSVVPAGLTRAVRYNGSNGSIKVSGCAATSVSASLIGSSRIRITIGMRESTGAVRDYGRLEPALQSAAAFYMR